MSHETTICADVIATYKGELVVIERHTQPAGLALPGGKQNPGELLSDTAKREFLEETGLTLFIDDVLGTYAGEDRDPRGAYISTVFIGRAEGDLRHEPGKTRVIPMTREALSSYLDQLLFDHARIIEDYWQSASKAGSINPSEAAKRNQASVPDAVFEAFNELIVEKLHGGKAVVKQKDVVVRMVQKGLNEKDIYDKHWLDVEPAFRARGWKAKYDRPAYDENFDAYFTFEMGS